MTARARGKPSVIAPLALEAVKRIDAIFAIEREINGRPADEQLAVRRARTAPLVSDLEPPVSGLNLGLDSKSLRILAPPMRLLPISTRNAAAKG